MRMQLKFLVAAVVTFVGGSTLALQSPPPAVEATPVEVDAPITAVTLYPGRAAVTRSASLDLQSGVYDLKFKNLPATVQPDTLQARTAGGVRVLGVEYVQSASADPSGAPEVIELDKRIRQLAQALRAMTNQRELIKSQEEFLSALTIRATADAANNAGSERLDLDAVKKQMEFISTERKRLLGEKAALDVEQPKLEADLQAAQANREAAAGKAMSSRTAVVSVVAPDAFKGEITLTYLVSSASWQPAYNVRAASDLSNVQIEYDAMLTQRSGEDWNEVRLTLSTAQPTLAANPPALDPWYVDVYRPELARGLVESAAGGRADGVERLRSAADDSKKDKSAELKELADDAAVAGSGPSVTFELPRSVTVKTNIDRLQRTRIATFDSRALFVHVATPLSGEAVYLRGDLANSSAYQLLSGPASIFSGQDYIGATSMPSVAPAGQFKVHFGIDNAVKVRRQLLSKNTENTGLLSGGRRTIYDFRVTIDNGSGRDIILELWDRVPVSRNEEIQIELVDPSPGLAEDQHYLAEQRPLGLLKWWLAVPASSRERNALAVSWRVRINRAKDIEMTPLPE